jgi:hypothetical protein
VKGADVNVAMGIVHSVWLIIVESDPSQSTRVVAYESSDLRNQILYPVIGVPLSAGLTQFTTT